MKGVVMSLIKLGIGSRRELGAALGNLGPDRPAA
jgi:hypothetical protein